MNTLSQNLEEIRKIRKKHLEQRDPIVQQLQSMDISFREHGNVVLDY